MQLITRAEWGARDAKYVNEIDLKGPSTVHWSGGGTKWDRIEDSDEARLRWGINKMKAGQNYHMDGRGWSDIGYNFALDPWGVYGYEGRGLDRKPASQGTREGNKTSHSIQVMTGLGDPDVGIKCLRALDHFGTYIANEGTATDEFMGHRDWKATVCPGDFLYTTLPRLNDPSFTSAPPVPPLEMSALRTPVAMFALAGGYGVVDANGRIESVGSGNHYGDLRNIELVSPIVDGEGTSSGRGYYLASADGGVFAFGDAPFHGSIGGTVLDKPIVAIEVEPGGYWLVASDGGIFAFGLPFKGSFVGQVVD